MLDEVRQARVEAARRCRSWVEIQDDLVPRARGLFVSAGDDHVYARYAGTVFQTGSTTIVSDRAALFFTVDDAGVLTFYERDSQTWSERVARRAQLEARRRAPRQPMRRGAA
jgi:hypothetical protein